MAQSIVTPGTLIFASALTVMIAAAGAASLPPERNTRVLAGAAIMLGAWVAALAAVSAAGTHGITSLLFALDAFCAFLFYLLARPARGDASKAVYRRNWASYVVGVFVALIFLQTVNLIARYDGWHQAPLSALLALLSALIAFGFFRGFGARAGLIFLLSTGLLAAAAFIFYVRVANFLTLMAIVIITHAAIGGAWRNIRRWRGKESDPPRPPSHANLSVVPTGVRNRP